MKSVTTIVGRAYVVTTATECTVSTSQGVVITTCPSGQQTVFIAPTSQVCISDDEAFVTESFRPASLSASGGGRSLTVDAVFNPESTNAQSGTAIASELRRRLGDTTWDANHYSLDNLVWLSFPADSGRVALLLGANRPGKEVRFVLEEYPLRVLGEQTFEVACSSFQVNTGAEFNNGLSVNGARMTFNGIPVATEGTLEERLGPTSYSSSSGELFTEGDFMILKDGARQVGFVWNSAAGEYQVYCVSKPLGICSNYGVTVRGTTFDVYAPMTAYYGLSVIGDSLLSGSATVSGRLFLESSLEVDMEATFNSNIMYGGKEIGAYMKEQLALPPGTIITSLATGMPGWLRCQGQTVSKTTYAALYAAIGDMFKQEGDTDKTLFRLPDFRRRTLWGAWGNLGSYLEAGLPEISGVSHPIVEKSPDGCYSVVTVSNYYDLTPTSSKKDTWSLSQSFKASRSNSIYGAADTVQPPAVAVNVFIKT